MFMCLENVITSAIIIQQVHQLIYCVSLIKDVSLIYY